jgi:hypothetical protein
MENQDQVTALKNELIDYAYKIYKEFISDLFKLPAFEEYRGLSSVRFDEGFMWFREAIRYSDIKLENVAVKTAQDEPEDAA